MVLRDAGAASALAVIAVTSDDALNRRACRRARDVFGITTLVARANDPANREELIKNGIRTVSVPLSIAGALENALLRPNLFQLLVDQPKAYDVLELAVRNPALNGVRLQNVPLPGNAMVLLIRRQGRLLAPRGSTVLQLDDQLTVAGDEESVWRAAELV